MSKVKVKMILPTISLSWLKLFNNSCRKLELNSSPFKCKRSTIRSFHLFQMVFRKREDGAVGLSHRALLLHDGTQHSMTLYAHIWHGPRLHTTEPLSSCKMVILDIIPALSAAPGFAAQNKECCPRVAAHVNLNNLLREGDEKKEIRWWYWEKRARKKKTLGEAATSKQKNTAINLGVNTTQRLPLLCH